MMNDSFMTAVNSLRVGLVLAVVMTSFLVAKEIAPGVVPDRSGNESTRQMRGAGSLGEYGASLLGQRQNGSPMRKTGG